MIVGKIQGASGMERGGGRPDGVDGRRYHRPFAADDDSASISQDGRESAAAVERLTGRARQGYDRSEVIAEAATRLRAGHLDDDAVYRAVARTLLDAD